MKIYPDSSVFLSVMRIFFQKKSRLCLAEPVDALFDISYHKPVFPSKTASADAFQYRFLHQVGILILIHHDFFVVFCKYIRCLGRQQLSILFPRQYFKCQMLLVCKVQNVFLPFLLLQPLHKGKGQLYVDLYISCRFTKLCKLFFVRYLEILFSQSLHCFFHPISEIHHILAQFLIRICHHFSSSARKACPGNSFQSFPEPFH